MTLTDWVAVIVEPLEPFRAWDRGLEADSPIDGMDPDDLAAVYLLARDDGTSVNELLAGRFTEIFEEQLDGWSRDRRGWPADRTGATFREWFAVRVIDLMLDAAE